MSGRMNWDRVRKEQSSIPRKKDYILERLIKKADNPKEFKKKMDKALEEYGWQKCSRCGGGRHPMFAYCKKCRENEKVAKKGK